MLLTVAAVRATVPSTPCLLLSCLKRGLTLPHSQEINPCTRKELEEEGKVQASGKWTLLIQYLEKELRNNLKLTSWVPGAREL